MVYPLFAHLLVPVKIPQVPCLLFAYAKTSAIRYSTLACYVARRSKFIHNITKWSLFLAQTEVCFVQECELSSYRITPMQIHYHSTITFSVYVDF